MKTIFALIFCIALSQHACQRHLHTSTPPHNPLLKQWGHLREADTDGMMHFRPVATFKFPPSRGRNTLEFVDNTTAIYSYPGPTDATVHDEYRYTRTAQIVTFTPITRTRTPLKSCTIAILNDTTLTLRDWQQ